jgi:hypothetical protein
MVFRGWFDSDRLSYCRRLVEDKQGRRVVEIRKDAILGAEVRVVFGKSLFIFWPGSKVSASRCLHKL